MKRPHDIWYKFDGQRSWHPMMNVDAVSQTDAAMYAVSRADLKSACVIVYGDVYPDSAIRRVYKVDSVGAITHAGDTIPV